jgi:hypothetical protein
MRSASVLGRFEGLLRVIYIAHRYKINKGFLILIVMSFDFLTFNLFRSNWHDH